MHALGASYSVVVTRFLSLCTFDLSSLKSGASLGLESVLPFAS
jgi:hypothetical protein